MSSRSPAGRPYFRNYGDHYELVVSPGSDPPMDDIRHAFLHFLLDPMAIRYRAEAARASPLLEYAARAPRLPVEFHDDYSAFFSECLVRAVELRLRHLAPGDLASAIDQAESAGYVLVRPIYAGLSGFEKSEPAMGYYFPDLIKGIDVAAEARRLRGVKFSDAAAAGDADSRRRKARPWLLRNPQRPRKRISPKGSARFPRGTARRRRHHSNGFLRLIQTICARRMAWPWPRRFWASRIGRANSFPR